MAQSKVSNGGPPSESAPPLRSASCLISTSLPLQIAASKK
jgi:hypothetical protein